MTQNEQNENKSENITIGEAAEKMAQEQFELYKSLKKGKGFSEKQVLSFAENDLIVSKLVSEFALKRLRAKIEKLNKGGKQ